MFFPDAAHTTAVISITVMRRKAFQTRVRLQIAGKLSHMLQVSPNTGSQAAKAMQGANGVKAKQKSADLPVSQSPLPHLWSSKGPPLHARHPIMSAEGPCRP